MSSNLASARRPVGLVLSVVLAALLFGCAGSSTSDRDLTFVTPSEGDTLVQGRRRLLGIAGTTQGAWLDPRTEREFLEGHIPGAINMPAEYTRERHGSLSRYDLVIVYGDSFNDPLAIAVSKGLIELGHDARTLRGGLRAWEAAGNRLVQGAEDPPDEEPPGEEPPGEEPRDEG